jgi:hypothetical protein
VYILYSKHRHYTNFEITHWHLVHENRSTHQKGIALCRQSTYFVGAAYIILNTCNFHHAIKQMEKNRKPSASIFFSQQRPGHVRQNAALKYACVTYASLSLEFDPSTQVDIEGIRKRGWPLAANYGCKTKDKTWPAVLEMTSGLRVFRARYLNLVHGAWLSVARYVI